MPATFTRGKVSDYNAAVSQLQDNVTQERAKAASDAASAPAAAASEAASAAATVLTDADKHPPMASAAPRTTPTVRIMKWSPLKSPSRPNLVLFTKAPLSVSVIPQEMT